MTFDGYTTFPSGRYLYPFTIQAGTGENAQNGNTVAIDLLYPVNLTSPQNNSIYTIKGTTFYLNVINVTYGNNFYVLLPQIQQGFYLLRIESQNYYSCNLIYVNESTSEITLTGAGSIIQSTDPGYNFTAGQDNYLSVTENAGYLLITRLTGPIATPITAYVGYLQQNNPNLLPNSGSYYSVVSTAGALLDNTPIAVGICVDGMDQNPETYFVDVIPTPGIGATPWNIELYSSSQNRLNVPDGTRSITYAHLDYLYFYTQASSGVDGSVRIVLQVGSTSTALPTTFQGASNCEFTAGLLTSKSTTDPTTLCIDLPVSTNTKYIMVSAMPSGYTIGAQKGACSAYMNDATTFTISITLLLLSVLFALLF